MREAKQALRLFNDLVILAIVLTAVLVAAALLVSVRRRRTALWLGLGSLFAFVAARVIEAQLEKAVVDAVKTQGGAAVARSVLSSAVESLNGFFVWVAVAGAIVAVAAVLAGRPSWLEAIGRGVAQLFGVASDLSTPDTGAGRWMAAHLDLLRIAGIAVAVVVLLFVTGSLTAVIVVVLALAVYELALTAYAVGVPRELDETRRRRAAGGGLRRRARRVRRGRRRQPRLPGAPGPRAARSADPRGGVCLTREAGRPPNLVGPAALQVRLARRPAAAVTPRPRSWRSRWPSRRGSDRCGLPPITSHRRCLRRSHIWWKPSSRRSARSIMAGLARYRQRAHGDPGLARRSAPTNATGGTKIPTVPTNSLPLR